MDDYSSRRSSGGLVVSRRGPTLLRDSAENNKDRNVQVCSRAGCSSRLNHIKDAQTNSPSKVKTPKTPYRSPHGKEIVGCSSKSPVPVNTSRKSYSGSKKKISFNLENDSESSSILDDSEEASDSTPKSGKTLIRVHPDPNGLDIGDTKLTEVGNSKSGTTNKLVKRNTQRLGVGRQDSGSSVSGSFPFKQTSQGSKNVAGTSRYNLRNLRCNSISDIVPSGCSSPTQRDIGRKRIGEPESSLTGRGKKMNGPTLDDRRNDNFNRGISISDSRPSRNLSSSGNNDANSVRNRRSTFRTSLSNQDNRSRMPLVESPLLTPSELDPDISIEPNAFSSDDQLTGQIPSYRATSFSRPGNSNDRSRSDRSNGQYDVGISRSFLNRDALRQCGIAEMLLALDRIEQDDEPSYEQLLVLETNLFLGGLGFHDQHREMRLDIDNMSYEELLALGDRMGTVTTAVPEEDLAKCLKKSVFQGTVDCREDEDDVKCCICQEEYAEGDEVGRLDCDHRYHIDCVNQWLRMKNWCPICKASATPLPLPA